MSGCAEAHSGMGGGKLLAVTHRNPGLQAEREIERWEDATRCGRPKSRL